MNNSYDLHHSKPEYEKYLIKAKEHLIEAEKAFIDKQYNLAEENYEIGLFLISNIDERKHEKEIKYRLIIGVLKTKQMAKSYGEQEHKHLFEYAVEYAIDHDHEAEVLELYFGAWEYAISDCKYEEADAIVNDLFNKGLVLHKENWIQFSYYFRGMIHLMTGDVKSSREHALKSNRQADDQHCFSKEITLLNKSLLMVTEWLVGNHAVSVTLEEEVIDDLKNIEHKSFVIASLFALSLHAYNKRDLESLKIYSEYLLDYAMDSNRVAYEILAKMFKSWSSYFIYKNRDEISSIKKNYTFYCTGLGSSSFVNSIYAMMIAEICLDTGNYVQGINLVSFSMENMCSKCDKLYETEFYRCKGELSYLIDKDRVKALSYYNKGMKIARERDLKSFEWRIKESSKKLVFI